MISFLPISILAYALNAGSILVDKILLQKSLPKPIIYTFYAGALQLLALVLIPFGFTLEFNLAFFLAIFSGVIFVAALFAFFTSLKLNEASLVGPVVGSLNPLFTALIGGIFLNQILTLNQYLAIFTLIIGAFVLAFNTEKLNLKFNRAFGWMVLAGLLFAISYIFLREAFLQTTFINGLIISRFGSGIAAMTFLLFPTLRSNIFARQNKDPKVTAKHIVLLLAFGQIMGGLSGILITYGVSITSPALVNSFFGVQYLVILIAAVVLYKKNPLLLDERLTKKVIGQKLIGVIVLSFGLYLLAK